MEEENDNLDLEPAFVCWQGGVYEAFCSKEEADHEMLAMAGRGLRGWATTEFEEILSDLITDYPDLIFREADPTTVPFSLDHRVWEGRTDDRKCLVAVKGDDFKGGMSWAELVSLPCDAAVWATRRIDLSELKLLIRKLMSRLEPPSQVSVLGKLVSHIKEYKVTAGQVPPNRRREKLLHAILGMESEILSVTTIKTA